MTGDRNHGDAVADKARDEFDTNRRERERSIERLRVRAEMRSEHEEEDTGVIHLRADERIAKRASDPPTRLGVIAVAFQFANSFPAWGKVIVALASIAAYVALKWAGKVP